MKINKLLIPLISILLVGCSNSTLCKSNTASEYDSILKIESSDTSDNGYIELIKKYDGEEVIHTYRIFNNAQEIIVDGYRYVTISNDNNFSLALYETEQSMGTFASIVNNYLTFELDQEYKIESTKWKPVLLGLKSESISLDTSKIQKTYNVGDEIDFTNLKVTSFLNDGTIKVLSKDEFDILPYDLDTPGYHEIVINVGSCYSSFKVIVKGYTFKNYNDKLVYYYDEEFDKNLAELTKFDDSGITTITDYNVTITQPLRPGLSTLIITYEDFYFEEEIVVMKKPTIEPLFYQTTSTSSLILFVDTITTTKDVSTVSNGTFMYKNSYGIYFYELTTYLDLTTYVTTFTSVASNVSSRVKSSNGGMETKVNDDVFVAAADDWHHAVLGW